MNLTRRAFIAGIGATAIGKKSSFRGNALADHYTFKLGILPDEISSDLEHALKVVREFGLPYVELRSMWGKNLLELSPQEVSEVKRLVQAYGLKVSDIASPIYKCDLPGVKTKAGPRDTFGQAHPFEAQKDLLLHAIDLAKTLNTGMIRIFAFWRVDKPDEVFADVIRHLKELVAVAEAKGIKLGLENEFACNVGTGAEAATVIREIRSPQFGLVWDPGNAAMLDEMPYPDGYLKVKGHILHMHVKDVRLDPQSKQKHFTAVGLGVIDYTGQMKALRRDGYEGTVSVETHYNIKGNKEAASREAMTHLIKVCNSV